MKAAFVTLACVALANNVVADPASISPASPTCVHSGGYIDGPFVPSASSARRVYLAVRDAIAPKLRTQHGARIVVQDEGDHWAVFSGVPVKRKNGYLVATMGEGDLGLEINKCTG